MQITTVPTVNVPAPEATASKAPASKAPASKAPASKAPASKAPASKAPANKEGESGKGSVHPEKSHAQRVADFRTDTAALVTTLQAMGANVKTQSSRNGVFVYRVYGDLVALRASRDKATGSDKPLARAALAAFEAVAGFRSGDRWVSATLYAESAYFGIKRKPGDNHPGAK